VTTRSCPLSRTAWNLCVHTHTHTHNIYVSILLLIGENTFYTDHAPYHEQLGTYAFFDLANSVFERLFEIHEIPHGVEKKHRAAAYPEVVGVLFYFLKK
jgi:hypothetical protein